MIQITLTETRLSKNPNTKTTYIVDSNKVEPITESQYNNYINSIPFFRRLGGSESLQRAYTCYGYKVYKLTSKSPDKQTKVVREFNFKDI
jgi:N-acetyl-anhydromuramyl-L-alanine amidase AmpD